MAGESIISAVKTEDKAIAITFDDGPNPIYTPLFLDVLREYGAKATFYALGSNGELYPDIVKLIHEEGHELGNHSYSHPHFPQIAAEEQKQELAIAERLIESMWQHNESA